DSGIDLLALKVDGGAAANNFLLQFQADIINTKVERPACIETTALGAAYLGGLQVGYWKNTEEIAKNAKIDKEFSPSMPRKKREALLKGWSNAVKKALTGN
ncbi:MAG: FGGY-family carbohydrate kinase, partial [Bacillota bacterium]|nr:FGGY-family carbohydrate kinase [Bacillota bacterium]